MTAELRRLKRVYETSGRDASEGSPVRNPGAGEHPGETGGYTGSGPADVHGAPALHGTAKSLSSSEGPRNL